MVLHLSGAHRGLEGPPRPPLVSRRGRGPPPDVGRHKTILSFWQNTSKWSFVCVPSARSFSKRDFKSTKANETVHFDLLYVFVFFFPGTFRCVYAASIDFVSFNYMKLQPSTHSFIHWSPVGPELGQVKRQVVFVIMHTCVLPWLRVACDTVCVCVYVWVCAYVCVLQAGTPAMPWPVVSGLDTWRNRSV